MSHTCQHVAARLTKQLSTCTKLYVLGCSCQHDTVGIKKWLYLFNTQLQQNTRHV